HPRPYRVWAYPLVPIVFIAASGAFVLNTLVERTAESLAGLGFLAIGHPAYSYQTRHAASRTSDSERGDESCHSRIRRRGRLLRREAAEGRPRRHVRRARRPPRRDP